MTNYKQKKLNSLFNLIDDVLFECDFKDCSKCSRTRCFDNENEFLKQRYKELGLKRSGTKYNKSK